jgi:hypothetical protein
MCPARQRASWRFRAVENGEAIDKYWTSACPSCVLKSKCTPGKNRCISRWEQEEVFEQMQRRLDERPELAMLGRCTVEHPYGTLKAWMGATRFLMKTLPKVKTEMSLHVLTYNMKRMMKILETLGLVEAISR